MAASASSQPWRLMDCSDDYARREPVKAVSKAFVAGLFLSLLPLGALAEMLVAVAISLLRPGLFFLGLLKARELCVSLAPQEPPPSSPIPQH